MKKVFLVLLAVLLTIVLLGCNSTPSRDLRKAMIADGWVEENTKIIKVLGENDQIEFNLFESSIFYYYYRYVTAGFLSFSVEWDLTTGNLEIDKSGYDVNADYNIRDEWNFYESESCLIELTEGCYPEDFLIVYNEIKPLLDSIGLTFEDFLVEAEETTTTTTVAIQ